MWQSAHARPLPSSPSSRRSKNANNPRATALQGSPPHNVPGASGLASVRWLGAGEILALLALISIDEQRTSAQAISKDGCFTMSLPMNGVGVMR
jgi:hypothetical protein